MRRNGFTIIELIIFICLIGVMTIIALPVFNNLSSDAKLAAAEQGEPITIRDYGHGIYVFKATSWNMSTGVFAEELKNFMDAHPTFEIVSAVPSTQSGSSTGLGEMFVIIREQ